MKSSASGKCSECGKAAKVHVTWVKAGQPQTAAFCEKDALAAGVLDAMGYDLLEAGGRADTSPRCPVCDCSQRDFERHGRFGCPACYGAFTGLLTPMLGRIHRGLQHRGKFPYGRLDPSAVRHRMAQLQAELDDAVRTDRTEGAAQTRDALEALQSKLPPPPTDKK